MIKISKYLHIHMITVILFVVVFFCGRIESVAVAYAIMLIHELAHLAAALCIGLKPDGIFICPFGVNLKLKNKMIYSLADEIILYAAGPFSNIVMALAAVCFFSEIPYSYDFYVQNIALFVLNMLPVMPLDGGIIARKILSYRIGNKKCNKVMKAVSLTIVVILSAVGIYFFSFGKFNYSIVFLCVFLICNIIMSKEKYNIDFLKELLYYKENKNLDKKVKIVAAAENSDLKKIASDFTGSCYYVVFFVNNRGKITEMLTETEIIEKICEKT